jgi:hypothetical protein
MEPSHNTDSRQYKVLAAKAASLEPRSSPLERGPATGAGA